MADSLVSFVLEQLASIIQQDVQQKVSLDVGLRKEIKKLTTTFKAIQAVINDAERRQIKDELVKIWLHEFKYVAYEMEDILDEWSTEILRSQIDGVEDSASSIDKNNKVHNYLSTIRSSFSKVTLRHDIATRIKEIREKVDWIENEKNKYRLIRTKTTDEEHLEPLETGSMVDVSEVYGRDLDKEIIVNKLLGESSSSGSETCLPVIISIVGMGGLGKTTLAQLIFNDEVVKAHFDMTMWVCVSDPFNLKRVTTAIIQEAGESISSFSEWNALHHRLRDTVKGKRFFLVLDDVWTDDPTKWDPLMLCLKFGAQGSRVLVTTRNEGVALMIDTTYIHHLENLHDEYCCLLLSRIAFLGRKEEDHEVLKELSTKIAKKCKGLPLAVKTLGSLLRFKKTEKDWHDVLESDIWELDGVGNSVLQSALLLSYYALSSPLKRCFTYCTIFPKDHVLCKDSLTRLWMAQGFLNTTQRKGELEIIGELYFNSLVMRSFFQYAKGYRMHDLVHDFALFLTNSESVSLENDNTEFLNYSSKTRHLTLVCEDAVKASSFHASVRKIKHLRSLQFVMTRRGLRDLPSDLFHHLRFLRVLSLDDANLTNLPSEIEKLVHLRYLDLSRNRSLKKLPDSLSNLYNMQTLKLYGCYKLSKLPKGMGRMINLRHLDIEGTEALRYLPRGFGNLSHLQSLEKFLVAGAGKGCHIGELKELNLLQGNLTISGLKRVANFNEACESKLKEKPHLHALHLKFEPGAADYMDCENEDCDVDQDHLRTVERMEGILQGLQPHPNLKQLDIMNYGGSKLASWMVSKSLLPNLSRLDLYGCHNCTELPALGQLPCLEMLTIEEMPKLLHIGVEFYGISGERAGSASFPKLEILVMNHVASLEKWDLQIGDGETEIMPCLHRLRLNNASMKVLPAFGRLPSLEFLELVSMNQVKHIGNEFSGIDSGCANDSVAFPCLKTLYLDQMISLEEWELRIQEGNEGVSNIFPCLQKLMLCDCKKLKALPALGKLPSLEWIKVTKAEQLKQLGNEFYGTGNAVRGVKVPAFPKLIKLEICALKSLVEWESGENIMPCLRKVSVIYCNELRTIKALANLPSLEKLKLQDLNQVTHIDHDGFGISDVPLGGAGDVDSDKAIVEAFPKLKKLSLRNLINFVEWKLENAEGENSMPCLESLELDECPKVKELPHYLPLLRELKITDCPALTSWTRFPQIERLSLAADAGLFSESLAFFPNLKSLEIIYLFMPFPKGLSKLKLLERIRFFRCPSFLTSMPKEVQKLQRLQEIRIKECYDLEPRCRKDGEDWSIISHIPNIFIDEERIQ